jgi:hypothetical protein
VKEVRVPGPSPGEMREDIELLGIAFFWIKKFLSRFFLVILEEHFG